MNELIERLRSEAVHPSVTVQMRLIAMKAADAIEALQAENERLKRDVACHDDMSNEIAFLRAERDALAAKLVPLEADAERLDWMKFHGAHVAWGNDDEVCDVRWSDRDGEYRTKLFYDWRAAIDAAKGGQHEDA